jgi:hypothetical protein
MVAKDDKIIVVLVKDGKESRMDKKTFDKLNAQKLIDPSYKVKADEKAVKKSLENKIEKENIEDKGKTNEPLINDKN